MNLSDYTYDLPEERIAPEPLDKRDSSRLLVYEKGEISHQTFSDITTHFGANDTVFFNDTRVIPARIHFYRQTGALIEIFLLEPYAPYKEMAAAMDVRGTTTWKCLVGNLKKWKEQETLHTNINGIDVSVSLVNREKGHVAFHWPESLPFSRVVEEIGKIPLPPYIKRDVTEEDKDRYQTVYNRTSGAVAAPTAGLHFTDEVLRSLEAKGVIKDFLTLHVSAGTFLPIKDNDVGNHEMHSEQVYVTRENLETLLASERITAVGTTSMRTLESLYWYGVQLPESGEFDISQDYPYRPHDLPGRKEAISRIAQMMDRRGLSALHGQTSIFIYPGYTFRMTDRLITNFHLPGSTLILLVAAFVGKDWKEIYREALDNNYRFLSYGDSSLLMPDQGETGVRA